MNANRIVQMVTRILVAKVLHFGINAGIDAVSRRKPSKPAPDHLRSVPEPRSHTGTVAGYDDPVAQEEAERAARRERRQRRQARRAAREARQAAKITRRATRM